MPQIDYIEGLAPENDPANLEMQGRQKPKTIKLAYFCTSRNAAWAADRGLQTEGYPLARVRLPVNRNAFRLQAGDQFRWTYPQWGISNMMLRILSITEDDIEKGDITLSCIEDINHISGAVFGDTVPSLAAPESETMEALENSSVVEAPYVLAGDAVKIVPLAAKEVGTEIGFYLYMSIDGGASYQKIATINSYALYGVLAQAYGGDTHQVDESDDGILIDFDVPRVEDLAQIQTITRGQMISGQNLALLGDEIITFQTVTPVTATRYRLTGICRGRYDTERADHDPGEEFWFLGTQLFQPVSHSELVVGAARKFKLVPFSIKRAGDISEATAVDHTVSGRATKPYKPGNLMANGSGTAARYTTDIVLAWTSRVRGDGAGLGDPQTVTDAAPVFEYPYTVEVWVAAVKVRTVTGIEDATWTYTQTMSIADNGSLPDSLTLKVKAVRTTGYLESAAAEIAVQKES